MKTIIFYFSGLALMATLLLAFTPVAPEQGTPWIVPEKNKVMKNPVKYDKTVAAALYSTHCKSCHGKAGLGDGTKAASLENSCGDFSTAVFQKQSDGSLFYKISEGRDEMPSFKKKIPDTEDIWQLVHFCRTLAE